MTGASGRHTVRSDDVGNQGGPDGPRSTSRPSSSSRASSGRSPMVRACQGWAGSSRYPDGAAGPVSVPFPFPVSVPVWARSDASVRAGSGPPWRTMPGCAANQCSRNAPCSSGEYRAVSAAEASPRFFAAG
ncbi:hypothetical protein FrEUN1fDRAFT_2930 [Parafrankia sp. EUN1f]|nr:hypothetical protein FrEUN1fDRAFT_2930 [Parafrankia sp. EUN1f]